MSVRLNSHLSDKQLTMLRDKLLAEAERIRANFQLKKSEYENHSITGAKDEVDSANDNILLAADMRFSNRESLYYKKIMKTLSKIESDQYGMCDECGESITYSRLIARPTSEMCILCKEESEREESQNFFERRSKSLGREMSVSGH
ncbi:TraR/DksA family transcriptional regulator [Peredibacter sp. HCB2-198]|uniref:TraR/DksA family transcriptional regulator n=1 Tax=Peredibacter sp. HCB2-198 TaxID=3383025 RepID=UPI0038B43BDA